MAMPIMMRTIAYLLLTGFAADLQGSGEQDAG